MQIFHLATAPIKIHQIPHVIFGTKGNFFFKLYITLQCHETQLLRTFSSKSLHAMDKRIPSKCTFSHFWLLAWKLTKFLMSFFKPQVRFPSPEIFYLNHYMLWTKRAYQWTIFQTFSCSNESSPMPNSSSHFWNPKARVYSNFTSLFSVMKDNSAVFL